jgi:hypothetical protein
LIVIKLNHLLAIERFGYIVNAFLSVSRNIFMVNPNSWYIAMHFDRLNQELLDGFNKQVETPKKKKSKKPDISDKVQKS